ncbi:MAG: Putative SOS response-associated peptidase YedK [Candidatus Moanabacter tarae]|uniref:Abasic site processing protein n=1 Tax=Candidatus Moanibacter tarae TaxID=2200854 RepID=A0A2Z4AEN0_9BACT|nr:MAG: Putative SOS response-associated peptidase YedK [Candidatus Moanabacter tarae]|tara:strand:- start:16893 stop:17642 length:750 start_codon:yes stop_codon:yes gene_type:complete
MCGRYALTIQPAELSQRFLLRETSEEFTTTLKPRFNICPGQTVTAVRTSCKDRLREGVNLSWGLVPPWATTFKVGYKMINARKESVADKPAFRAAFNHRRCIIPATGFYEWQNQGSGKLKQPFFFSLKGNEPMALAGLWERWQDSAGINRETCAILTTSANKIMQDVHHRMPVILEEKSFDLWLDPTIAGRARLKSLFHPISPEKISRFPVSKLVNNPKNDGPELLKEVRPEPQSTCLQGSLFPDLDDD